MRTFNYSEIKKQKWDSDVLSLIAAIYKEAGKQEMYLKQRPEELEKLVEIAKIQSTEASNAIEGIVTTSTRIKQIVEEKTTPKNCDEQEIAGYRDVLNIIHESFDAIPITQNYILQLHKILYSHMNNPMAGRTKSVQNYISATYPDGHVETLFTPLAPYDTPQALDRICEEYNRVIGNMEVEPLIAIPIFIHDFLCIHQFNDFLQHFCYTEMAFMLASIFHWKLRLPRTRICITTHLVRHRLAGMKGQRPQCHLSSICLVLFLLHTKISKNVLNLLKQSCQLSKQSDEQPYTK